ncbi:MAG: LEA type 2 family protein, partial [Desulfococcaceae bacterium]
MIQTWRALALAAMMFSVAGCVHDVQQLIDEPTLEFVGMTLTDTGVFSATPVFQFALSNSNPMGLGIRDIAYDLRVNGRKFVKGVSDQNARLPAGGREAVSLPIPFSFLDLFPSIPDFREAEAIPYELSGTIGVGPYDVPYQTAGRFGVPGLPEVSLEAVRLSGLEPEMVLLTLNLELRNPNPFPIHPRRIHYRVAMEGRELSSGAVGELPEIPASDRAGITVSVRVGILEAPDLADRLSAGEPVAYAVEGDVAFSPPRRGHRGLPFQRSGEIR